MRLFKIINIPNLLLLCIATIILASVPASSVLSNLFWYQSAPGQVIDVQQDILFFSSQNTISANELTSASKKYRYVCDADYIDLVTPNWCVQLPLDAYSSFLQNQSCVLSFDYHLLSDFRAYLLESDGSLTRIPCETTGTIGYVVSIPPNLSQGSKLIATFTFSPAPLNVSLWHEPAYHQFENRYLIFLALGLIFLFAFLCVNIFLFDTTGNVQYVLHALAVLFALLTSTIYSGFSSVLFQYRFSMLIDSLMSISSSLSFLLSSMFIYSFLQLRRFGNLFRYLLLGILAINLFFFFSSFVMPFQVSQSIFNVLTISYYFYHILAIIACFVRRYPISRFYVIGIVLTISCLIVFTLSTLGFLSLTFFTTRFCVFSIVPLEGILFTLAILDQVKIDRKYTLQLEQQASLSHARISELLLRENHLEENLSFLQNLIDAIPFPIYFADRTGAFMGANQSFTILTGISFQSAEFSTISLFSDELTLALQAMDEDLILRPRSATYEYAGPFFNGSACSLNFHKSVFYDSAGIPAGVVSMIHDITTMKEAEVILRNRKEQLEALVLLRTQELENLNEALAADIEKRKITEQNLNESKEKLRELATELTLVEERERRSISAYIHDNISQLLALSVIRLNQMLERNYDAETMQSHRYLLDLISEAITKAQNVMYDLGSPILYEFGLVPAIQSLCERLLLADNIQYDMSFEPMQTQLSNRTSILIYAICRELIYNILKHARATFVQIRFIETAESLEILVHDNGVGFSMSRSTSASLDQMSFGLFSIRERLASIGGSVQINTTLQKGTDVHLQIPIANTNSILSD